MATSLPEDPGDEIFTKTCFVCREDAKEGQEHIKNYGGIVCFSCRAFFRRSHRKSRMPDYECKFGGNCRITKKNRRRCQSCRYIRCLKAGMKPDAVLTDDQKQIRFRKLIQKRKLEEELGLISNTVNRRARATSESARRTKIANKKTGKRRSKARTSDTPTTSMSSLRNDLESNSENNDENSANEQSIREEAQNEIPEISDIVPQRIKSKVSEIVEKYKTSIVQSSLSTSFCDKLTAIHSGYPDVNLESREVVDFLTACSHHFRVFALLHREFQELTKKVQEQLLSRNVPLYIQMLVASYFNAADAEEQLKMLTDLKEQKGDAGEIMGSLAHLSGCTFLDVESFNDVTKLFKNNSDLNYYSLLIKSVKHFQLSSIEQRAILAYIILFNNEPILELSPITSIPSDVKILSKILFKIGIDSAFSSSREDVISSLSKMSIFCLYHINWRPEEDDANKSLSQQGIVMPYTCEEESWIKNQFNSVEDAHRSIPAGDELIDEFTMYSLGVPFSKQYFRKMFELGMERTRQIFKSQLEFCDLTDLVQNNVLATRSFLVFALLVAKNELCANGMEQLRFGFGSFESDTWMKKYKSVFNEAKVKKVGTLEACSSLPVQPTEDFKKMYFDIVKKIDTVGKNSDLYHFTMLLLMTEPTGDDSPFALSKLHSTYRILLNRRLNSVQEKERSFYDDPNDIIAKISEELKLIKKLANLLICMMPT